MTAPEKNYVYGEDPGVDMRLPVAQRANQVLRGLGSEETVIDLGEHGEVNTKHVRFRDAAEEGYLLAYIRQEVSDHKVIVPTVVTLGVVAAGLYGLKYRKK